MRASIRRKPRPPSPLPSFLLLVFRRRFHEHCFWLDLSKSVANCRPSGQKYAWNNSAWVKDSAQRLRAPSKKQNCPQVIHYTLVNQKPTFSRPAIERSGPLGSAISLPWKALGTLWKEFSLISLNPGMCTSWKPSRNRFT